MKNLKYKVVCAECKKETMSSFPNQKLCGMTCKDLYYGRYRDRKINKDISSGTVGAMSELKVSIKFLNEGYAVFRSLSPACFCDLIAIKNNEVMYLEVRTGYISTTGNVGFPKKISNIAGTPTHYAVYLSRTDEVKVIKI